MMDEQNGQVTVADVRERWSTASRALSTERQQAALNRSFIRNKQWVFYNKETTRLEEAPRVPSRVRATVNRIGPDSRRIIAKLMRRSIVFDVPPTTADDVAGRASRVAEAAIADLQNRQNWERMRLDHAWTTWEGGVGAICVEWDPTQGQIIGQDQMGRPVGTGDVKLTVLSLHEIACEPGTHDIEHASWWMRGQAFPPKEVQKRYRMEKPPQADAMALDGVYRLGDAGRDAREVPMTMVLTLYQRPFGDDPGCVCTVVNDTMVSHEPWPFPFTDRLNIATACVQVLHATWLGHTPISDAVPIQALYNASWSSIIEHLRQAGNARLWVPMGSVDDIEDLTDTPGEAVEYNPIGNLRPVYEAPPSMPDWWIRQPGMLEQALDDVLNVHEVSRGGAPSGVESGVALSILAENDDTPVGAFAKELGECWGRVASMVLQVLAARVIETRKAMIKLPSGVPEVVEWTGGDLAGQTTAIVPTDSVIPRSRAAQAAYAMQLYDRKIITNPQELAKIADLPDQDDLIEGIDPDTARARRENYQMAVGQVRTVDQIDEHANHLNVHRGFMKSERYEHLSPEAQQMFVAHLAAHEMYAAQQAAQQSIAMQMGGPAAAMIPTAASSVLPPEMFAGAQAAQAQQQQAEGAETPQQQPELSEQPQEGMEI
jgi:hypothetical protein